MHTTLDCGGLNRPVPRLELVPPVTTCLISNIINYSHLGLKTRNKYPPALSCLFVFVCLGGTLRQALRGRLLSNCAALVCFLCASILNQARHL